MLIYVNITDRQTDKHIKSIVRNLTKTLPYLLNLCEKHSVYPIFIFSCVNLLNLCEKHSVYSFQFFLRDNLLLQKNLPSLCEDTVFLCVNLIDPPASSSSFASWHQPSCSRWRRRRASRPRWVWLGGRRPRPVCPSRRHMPRELESGGWTTFGAGDRPLAPWSSMSRECSALWSRCRSECLFRRSLHAKDTCLNKSFFIWFFSSNNVIKMEKQLVDTNWNTEKYRYTIW